MITPAFIQEYENWTTNLELSELPIHLLDMYGVPHIDNPPFEELEDERG